MRNASPARIAPSATAIGPPSATPPVNASVSDNTRRAYAGALGQLDVWLDGRRLEDARLATYLAELRDAGRAACTPNDGAGYLVTRTSPTEPERSAQRGSSR